MTLNIKLSDTAKMRIVDAAVIVTYPIGFVGTLAYTRGGLAARFGSAVIWPALMAVYDLENDHTIGGYRCKWMLKLNKWLEPSSPR